MKVCEFLNLIYSNQDGRIPTVYVYDHDNVFYPETAWERSELILTFKSYLKPEYVLKKEILELEINGIYTYENDIYLTVTGNI